MNTIENYAKSRNNNYDFIRFFAASLVILSHAYPLSWNNTGELFLILTNGQNNLGNLAVSIFFIVSGFLITQSFDKSNGVLKFTLSRILRIYPALIASILFGAFLVGPIVTSLPLNDYMKNPMTLDYLKNLYLFPMHWNLPGVFEYGVDKNTSINGALWTIPYEVLCYGVVAILGTAKLLRYQKVVLFFFVLSVYALMHLKSFVPTDTPRVYWPSFVDLFPFFAAGMLMYAYRQKIKLNNWYAAISLFMLVLSANFGGFNYMFLIFGSYLIMYFVYNPKIKLNNFAKYGDFSYGLYIYAFPVQQTVTYFANGNISVIGNFSISFVVSLLLSFISWHLIEKNALKLKRHFTFKRKHSRNEIESPA